MTARDTMEASAHAALSKYKQALADGTWQRTADNTLVDAVLKAADVYALGAAAARRRQLGDTRSIDHALANAARDRAEAVNGDQPLEQAERRQVLDAYGVSRRTAL